MSKTLAGFASAVAAFLLLPLLDLGGAGMPSDAALTEIPPTYLALYLDAASRSCPGLPWSVLAAVGKVESNHGRTRGAMLTADGTVTPAIVGPVLDGSSGTARIRDTDRGHHDGDPEFDRAVGPMQFLPGTWAGYGIDASGDGVADPHNAIDAIDSAAAYLCAYGGADSDRLPDAIMAYNRSTEYVQRVLAIATRYVEATASVLAPPDTLIAMVLTNPRLTIYEAGRRDIAEGRIDARVLLFLQLASERWTLAVSSLQSGHSKCVGGGDYDGCDVSNHWYGRAVDVYRVNARAVSAGNGDARELVAWALDLGRTRPDEIGHPWAALAGVQGSFSDEAHHSHVHLGWGR